MASGIGLPCGLRVGPGLDPKFAKLETLPSGYRSLSASRDEPQSFPDHLIVLNPFGQLNCGNGTYERSFFQSVKSSTASLRATATTARFFARTVPSAARDRPYWRSALGGANGPRMYWAELTRS